MSAFGDFCVASSNSFCAGVEIPFSWILDACSQNGHIRRSRQIRRTRKCSSNFFVNFSFLLALNALSLALEARAALAELPLPPDACLQLGHVRVRELRPVPGPIS